ncbi:MAG TPA: hypothetical protein VGG79_22525 [Roseiarcus sp.]|jgi:intracellular multiplication protein IcmP
MSRSSRAPGAIGSDDYTVFSLLLIVVGLAILGWASWKLWHAEISTGALSLAHAEMQAIGLVTDRFAEADVSVQRAHAPSVQFDQLVRLYRNIGQEFLYPAMALVLALAAWAFLRAGNARFTRAFDLEKADGRTGEDVAQHRRVPRAEAEAGDDARRRSAPGRRRPACARMDRAIRRHRGRV